MEHRMQSLTRCGVGNRTVSQAGGSHLQAGNHAMLSGGDG
jgi:hypothetical protein